MSRYECVICDIDGTLAKHVARGPYDMDKLDTDALILPVYRMIRAMYRQDIPIILVSGRGEEYREQTKLRLNRNNILYRQLYMRPKGDTRPDTEIKKEILDKYITNNYTILFAIDDRTRIVDMRREQGIFTFDVNQLRLEF